MFKEASVTLFENGVGRGDEVREVSQDGPKMRWYLVCSAIPGFKRLPWWNLTKKIREQGKISLDNKDSKTLQIIPQTPFLSMQKICHFPGL